MSFRSVYGYTRSENGWRMVNRDGCVVGGPSVGVPHSNTAPTRAGDASTILVAWMWWYHRNVEPVFSSVWGWSATNDVANSNHLSGTALDINAPKYPWGYYRMDRATRAKVENGLRLFEGTVFWGRNWSKPDEMHYQLGLPEGNSKIAAFAAKLNAGHLGIYGSEPLPEKPVAPPVNLIDVEASIAAKWIGKRQHDDERKAGADGKGRYADFERGSIWWHPDLRSAIAVPTHLLQAWAPHDGGLARLGYPVLRHTVIEGVGDIQAFQKGVLYRRFGQPGYAVGGEIGRRWIREGFENGPLGWPINDEYERPAGGRRQDFQNGHLEWDPTGVVRTIEGGAK